MSSYCHRNVIILPSLHCLHRVMDNVKVLGDKVAQAEHLHKMAMTEKREINNAFRSVDRDLNALRPELMRLQSEKEQYTRYIGRAHWVKYRYIGTYTLVGHIGRVC